YILEDSNARLLIAHADLLRGAAQAIPRHVRVLAVATPPSILAAFELAAELGAIPQEYAAWDEWLDRPRPLAGLAPLGSETMIYTSGTTGHPKGVRREKPTPEQVEKTTEMRRLVYGIEPGIRSVLPGPMYHSAPNAFGLRAAPVAERLVL